MLWLAVVLALMNSLSPAASLWFIWYLRSLQMIIHLPLMRTILPTNAHSFFSVLIPVVTFDVLDIEHLCSYLNI